MAAPIRERAAMQVFADALVADVSSAPAAHDVLFLCPRVVRRARPTFAEPTSAYDVDALHAWNSAWADTPPESPRDTAARSASPTTSRTSDLDTNTVRRTFPSNADAYPTPSVILAHAEHGSRTIGWSQLAPHRAARDASQARSACFAHVTIQGCGDIVHLVQADAATFFTATRTGIVCVRLDEADKDDDGEEGGNAAPFRASVCHIPIPAGLERNSGIHAAISYQPHNPNTGHVSAYSSDTRSISPADTNACALSDASSVCLLCDDGLVFVWSWRDVDALMQHASQQFECMCRVHCA
ncbi:hypothetical protein EON66_05025 [archaeon]|nr:MAG: hypothetical protein EON66_05025 [archaeon]